MAGFREFLTGEVLTSANVNNFLMKQSVMVFADAAARTAALGAEVAEGMLTYNLDTDQLEVFDGAAFVSVASPPTTSATDLTSGTLANARLAAGTIVQVVQGTLTSMFTSASGSFVDIGLSAAITPSATSSKVLVVAYVSYGGNGAPRLNLVRGATDLFQGTGGTSNATFSPSVIAGTFFMDAATIVFLDTPSSTSSLTYKIQGATTSNLTINRRNADTNNSSTSSITLFEVKG